MNTTFETLDFFVFGVYALVILFFGLWVSRNKDGETKNAEDLADQVLKYLKNNNKI